MAVYERTYRGYDGELTPPRSRILVFPRYAYQEILRSNLFLALLVLCLVWPFALACALYIPHNLGFIKAFQLDPQEVAGFFAGLFDVDFFYNFFMLPAGFMALVITIIVGPVLVTSDMRNNGLALYFSRPVTRTDYVVGKALVLITLLSIVTWIPGLALFVFQCYLEGLDWMRANYRVGVGIFVGSWIWIAVLCLISLALSAYVKWRPVARMSLLVVFFVASGMSAAVNVMFKTSWGSVINIADMTHVIWAGLFGVEPLIATPMWVAWFSPAMFCAVSVLLLARKLRPYEVVR